MEPRLFDFKWYVDSEGHELVRGEVVDVGEPGSAARMLLSGDTTEIRRRGGTLREYEPFTAAPGIHRDFAKLVTDAHSALAFVQKYGFLGSMRSGPHEDSDRVEHLVSTAQEFRLVLEKIDHSKKHGDQSAMQFFNDHVTPHLTVRIEASKPKRPGLQIVPRSLVSWMWLCVAEEITNGVEYKRCANPKCPDPIFKVTRDGRKQRGIYCKRPACRQAVWRERDRKVRAKLDKQVKRKESTK